eukprot:gene10136-21136_t
MSELSMAYLKELSRKDLQLLAKAHNLKANKKSSELIEELLELNTELATIEPEANCDSIPEVNSQPFKSPEELSKETLYNLMDSPAKPCEEEVSPDKQATQSYSLQSFSVGESVEVNIEDVWLRCKVKRLNKKSVRVVSANSEEYTLPYSSIRKVRAKISIIVSAIQKEDVDSVLKENLTHLKIFPTDSFAVAVDNLLEDYSFTVDKSDQLNSPKKCSTGHPTPIKSPQHFKTKSPGSTMKIILPKSNKTQRLREDSMSKRKSLHGLRIGARVLQEFSKTDKDIMNSSDKHFLSLKTSKENAPRKLHNKHHNNAIRKSMETSTSRSTSGVIIPVMKIGASIPVHVPVPVHGPVSVPSSAHSIAFSAISSCTSSSNIPTTIMMRKSTATTSYVLPASTTKRGSIFTATSTSTAPATSTATTLRRKTSAQCSSIRGVVKHFKMKKSISSTTKDNTDLIDNNNKNSSIVVATKNITSRKHYHSVIAPVTVPATATAARVSSVPVPMSATISEAVLVQTMTQTQTLATPLLPVPAVTQPLPMKENKKRRCPDFSKMHSRQFSLQKPITDIIQRNEEISHKMNTAMAHAQKEKDIQIEVQEAKKAKLTTENNGKDIQIQIPTENHTAMKSFSVDKSCNKTLKNRCDSSSFSAVSALQITSTNKENVSQSNMNTVSAISDSVCKSSMKNLHNTLFKHGVCERRKQVGRVSSHMSKGAIRRKSSIHNLRCVE